MKPPIPLLICLLCKVLLLTPAVGASSIFSGRIQLLAREDQTIDPDLETVRNRIITDLLDISIDQINVEVIARSLQEDGSWPDINYEDVSRTGFEHSGHLSNMLELARAYKNPGTTSYRNDRIKKAVSSALDFWLEHDFICENWWWNEMGTPGNMIDLLLIMDDDLTGKQKSKGLEIAGRARMGGVGARPGGDLIQIAAMMGKQALFKRDEAFLEEVLKIMADEIKVTTGRGLKPDMSFHHRTDNVMSTLTYGNGYIRSFVYWILKIEDTKFALPDNALELLTDYFLDGITASMVHGKYPDPGARNREMTRRGALNPVGPELAENLLQASSYRQRELEEIVKIRNNEIAPKLTKTHFFWHSEYFSHQRPEYFASVRMHSSRNHTMEEPHNEEGLKMHHFGDGSNFISITGREYVDIYPVWDWQRIPGTTVVQKPELPHWKEIAKRGLKDFVGGVSDGAYGAVAFDFQSPHDPLRARKAWFFFDDEYISLGAGIQSQSSYPVNTTLNQTLLNTEVKIGKDGDMVLLPQGEHQLEAVSWVQQDKVAYLFPSPSSVRVRNATATGDWRQINHQAWATAEEVRKETFTLWLDHGIRPDNASYAYIVIPNIASSDIEDYQKKADVKILANTSALQAVQHSGLHQSQLAFYQPGEIKISKDLWLKVNQPCMLIVEADGNVIKKMIVSDPSQKLDALSLETSGKVETSGERWASVWNKDSKTSFITVNLPKEGYAGKSVVLWNEEE
jgi:chondroitin AC lyase